MRCSRHRAHHVCELLNADEMPGVVFRPAWFQPTFQKHAGERCGGLQLHVTDRATFRPVRTGLAVLRRPHGSRRAIRLADGRIRIRSRSDRHRFAFRQRPRTAGSGSRVSLERNRGCLGTRGGRMVREARGIRPLLIAAPRLWSTAGDRSFVLPNQPSLSGMLAPPAVRAN